MAFDKARGDLSTDLGTALGPSSNLHAGFLNTNMRNVLLPHRNNWQDSRSGGWRRAARPPTWTPPSAVAFVELVAPPQPETLVDGPPEFPVPAPPVQTTVEEVVWGLRSREPLPEADGGGNVHVRTFGGDVAGRCDLGGGDALG